MVDMETEAARFAARSSFAYAVLTPDGTRERGCVYIYPSKVAGHDAQVAMWLSTVGSQAGVKDFEHTLNFMKTTPTK